MRREKLGPAPTDPEHCSQLVARDAVESRLAAASANSDLMGDVAAMASRRERVKMKHDLALMETMTKVGRTAAQVKLFVRFDPSSLKRRRPV